MAARSSDAGAATACVGVVLTPSTMINARIRDRVQVMADTPPYRCRQ